MIYTNDDYRALLAADQERTGEDEESKYCSVCGTENPEEFYVSIQTDECVGCSDCVNVNQWIEY